MRLLVPMILLGLAAAAQSQDSRTELNLGVAAFKNQNYLEAIRHFAAAANLAPDDATPRLYLGTAYTEMYVPASESVENLKNAQLALEQFQQVLNLEPENEKATAYIANLYLNMKKFDEAAEWNKKRLALNPDNKEACYTLGVIAWSQWYPELTRARANIGMKPDDPGPLTDEQVRQDLETRWDARLDEGIRYLERALGIDPAYDDAMAYMNLLIRERADLADSAEDYRRDIATADDWLQQALEIRKRRAAEPPPRP